MESTNGERNSKLTAQAKYRASPKGKAAQAKCDATLKRKAAHAKYNTSPKGKATRKISTAKRYRSRKLKYMKLKGNICGHCGLKYTGKNACVFDFHHRDPDDKQGQVDMHRTDEWLDKEVVKCDLLCANCHRTYHSEDY